MAESRSKETAFLDDEPGKTTEDTSEEGDVVGALPIRPKRLRFAMHGIGSMDNVHGHILESKDDPRTPPPLRAISWKSKLAIPTAEGDENYSWDVCMVFRVGDKYNFITTKTPQIVNGETFMYEDIMSEEDRFAQLNTDTNDKLKNSNLRMRTFLSGTRKEIYVLLGATEIQLRHEAARTNFVLALNKDRLYEAAAVRKLRLYRKTEEASQGLSSSRLNKKEHWEGIHGRYDVGAPPDIYERYDDCTQRPNSLFRTVDRLKLTHSIIHGEPNDGGAGIDTSLRSLNDSGNPIDAVFPLHEPEKRDLLLAKWYPPSPWYKFEQPYEEIRSYFGEKIALYFKFLGYYTMSLMVPAILGIGFTIPAIISQKVDYTGSTAFGILICIWATLFHELWKREEKHLAVKWGQHDYRNLETTRPQFQGEWVSSPIDGKPMEYYPMRQRIWKEVTSIGVIGVLISVLIGAVAAMFYLRGLWVDKDWGVTVVAIINGIQIQIFNVIYGYVAEWLTEYENHRTDSEFEDSLIAKLFVFKFVNSYNALYYIAFIKAFNEGCGVDRSSDPTDCFSELRNQLAVVFATIIFMNNALEYFGPSIFNWFSRWRQAKDFFTIPERLGPSAINEGSALQNNSQKDAPYGILIEGPEDTDLIAERGADDSLRSLSVAEQLSLPEKEFTKQTYRTLDDYDEMVIQMGFVSLFIVAFPLTPLLALANNWLEIWLDSKKVCTIMRRPEPKGASDIGTFMTIMNIMTVTIVLTNLGVVVFVATDIDRAIAPIENTALRSAVRVAIFIVAEHILIGFKIFLDRVIPDIRTADREHIDRQEYIVNAIINGVKDDPSYDLKLSLSKSKSININEIALGFEPDGHEIWMI